MDVPISPDELDSGRGAFPSPPVVDLRRAPASVAIFRIKPGIFRNFGACSALGILDDLVIGLHSAGPNLV